MSEPKNKKTPKGFGLSRYFTQYDEFAPRLNNKRMSDQGFRLSREFTGYHRYAKDEGCQDLGCSHCLDVLAWADNIMFSVDGTIVETSDGTYGVPQMNICCIQGTWYFDLIKLSEHCKKDHIVYGTLDGKIIQRMAGSRYDFPIIQVFPNLKEFNEERQREEELKKQKAKKR